jgi:predicted RNA-binding protein YlxR (DUF448 family)
MTMMTEHVTQSERTCVGCGKHAAPNALVRLVLGPAGEIAVDAAGGAFGRGAHVHASRACIEKACKGGLSLAFKRDVKADPKDLAASIRGAFERRAVGLILGARRAGHLSIGSNEVTASAPFVVVAADAGSIAEKFERAINEGRAAVFGTKAALGKMFGSGETAVFAVNHEGVARALQEALAIRGEAEER